MAFVAYVLINIVWKTPLKLLFQKLDENYGIKIINLEKFDNNQNN